MPDRIREGVGVIGAEIACVPVGGFRADGGSSTLRSCNASGMPTIRKPNTISFYCTQWWIQELGGGQNSRRCRPGEGHPFRPLAPS